MIRRLLAATIGTLVTFLFLLVWNATQFMDPVPAFLVASLIGSVGGLFWPVLVGWLLVRRSKERRDEEIQKEVDKRLAEKGQ